MKNGHTIFFAAPSGNGYDELRLVGHRGSQRAAERLAAKVLQRRPVTETRTGRRALPAYCVVRNEKTGNDTTLDGPVRLVPSVGELGYW